MNKRVFQSVRFSNPPTSREQFHGEGMQQRKKWGKNWIQLSSIHFRCIRHLCSSRWALRRKYAAISPGHLVTHSPARPRESMKEGHRGCFSPGPEMCVRHPREHHPPAFRFSPFFCYFFSFPQSLFPFSLSISSLSLQSPQKGLTYTLAATLSAFDL